VSIARNPSNYSFGILIPTAVLGMFQKTIFMITLKDIGARLENSSIVMLTFVQLIWQIRSSIPKIPFMSFGEKMLTSFLLLSILPIINAIFFFHLGIDDDKS